MNIVLRVAAAYETQKSGMAIGDVPDIVRKWEDFLQKYRDFAPDVARVEELAKTRHERDAWQNLGREVWAFYADAESKLRMFPKTSFAHFQRLGVNMLFLAILQQYELPPALRKKVEVAARFWAKESQNRINNVEDGIKAYKKLMVTYETQLTLAKTALSQGKLRGSEEEGAAALNAGPFKLVNTGHFDQETMETCAAVVKEAVDRLQSKGLSKVCYGEVLVSNRLAKASVLAFYLISKDEMFIRTDLKREMPAAIKTVLHELGHRYYYQFAKSKHADIHNIYARLKGQANALQSQLVDEVMKDPAKRPQPGDTYDSKGEVYVVEKVEYKGLKSGYQIKMHKQNDPASKGSLPLDSWIRVKGYKLENKPSGFITPYAGTNASENFAEMFAYYCLNKLPDDQVESLKAVLV